jgi:hypothetical protein
MGKEGETWDGKWMGRGRTWTGIGWGKRTEAPRACRKYVNRQPHEIGGGGGAPQSAPETWEVRHSQNSKAGIFGEMPDNRERDLIEPTSRRKTGHQVRDGVAIPQPHLWLIIASVRKNYRDGKWRGAWGKEGPAIVPKWDPAQVEVPRPDTITEAMECSQKGIYHDCPPRDPTSSHMQLFAPNPCTEAADPCFWIREG